MRTKICVNNFGNTQLAVSGPSAKRVQVYEKI
jgi:hypothetical protein